MARRQAADQGERKVRGRLVRPPQRHSCAGEQHPVEQRTIAPPDRFETVETDKSRFETTGGVLTAMAEAGPAAEFTHFTLMVTGQIESGRYEGLDTLYCRYTFAFGDDWKVVSGVEEGITQLSTASGTGGEQGLLAVWNFPVDITFRATGAHGWPQVVISVYGSDGLGRSDVIIGYGATHLPVGPGRHKLYIRTFRPLASSPWYALDQLARAHRLI